MTTRYFMSDNAAGVHPKILEALAEANEGHEAAYGNDSFTKKAEALFQKHFGKHTQTYFHLTGTGSNVVALKSLLKSYECVLCAESAHLNRDECGAPENNIGCKILAVPTFEGKITVDSIAPFIRDNDMVHRAQPRIVSISQCTEWGTIYQPEEVLALSRFCRDAQLLLHVDGARFCNAAAALNTDFRQLSTDLGVDILSFGGTKNGLMAAEAVVVLNKAIADDLKFYRKQSMQLISKMRFVSAQFIALLDSNLWRELASHSNQMAKLLAELVKHSVEIVMPVESNVVFAKLPNISIVNKLQATHPFVVWQSDPLIVRWMTSFDSQTSEIETFARHVKELCHE